MLKRAIDEYKPQRRARLRTAANREEGLAGRSVAQNPRRRVGRSPHQADHPARWKWSRRPAPAPRRRCCGPPYARKLQEQLANVAAARRWRPTALRERPARAASSSSSPPRGWPVRSTSTWRARPRSSWSPIRPPSGLLCVAARPRSFRPPRRGDRREPSPVWRPGDRTRPRAWPHAARAFPVASRHDPLLYARFVSTVVNTRLRCSSADDARRVQAEGARPPARRSITSSAVAAGRLRPASAAYQAGIYITMASRPQRAQARMVAMNTRRKTARIWAPAHMKLNKARRARSRSNCWTSSRRRSAAEGELNRKCQGRQANAGTQVGSRCLASR